MSDTEGGFAAALNDNDILGHAVTDLGDIDGDGVTDVAVSAVGTEGGGGLFVLFLDEDGTVDSHQLVSATAGGFGGVIEEGDVFGGALAAIGDLNGDGVTELAVGASGDDDGDLNGGALWILFMNSDGTVASEQKISASSGGFTGEIRRFGGFGSSVAALGDLDRDGVRDVAVTSGNTEGSTVNGAVWILFLESDGTVRAHQKIDDDEGGFGGTLHDRDFGASVASLGDLDGDRVTELAVGGPCISDGGDCRGGVWILFMARDGTVDAEQKISQTEGGFGGELQNFDWLGTSVAGPGDLDGDGVPDLVVYAQASRFPAGGEDQWQGEIWVMFLNGDGTVGGTRRIREGESGFTGELDAGDFFGRGIAALGDLDADGFTDLAVGAYGDDDGGSERGAMWILFLDGSSAVSVGGEAVAPPAVALRSSPNPFASRTTVEFELPAAEHVTLGIHDAGGRRLTVLVDDFLPAGGHAVAWEGRDATGRTLPSGVYVYELRGASGRASGRVVLIR